MRKGREGLSKARMDRRRDREGGTFSGIEVTVSNGNGRLDCVDQCPINIPTTLLIPSRSLKVNPPAAQLGQYNPKANLPSAR